MDCNPPGSSVHGILQARILEWVAIFFSWESSWPRDWTWVSCIAGRFFTLWAIREALKETNKLNEVITLRPESHSTDVLIRRGGDGRVPAPFVCMLREEGGHLQARNRVLPRNQNFWHLDLGLLSSRAVRKCVSVFKLPSPWYFVMAAGANPRLFLLGGNQDSPLFLAPVLPSWFIRGSFSGLVGLRPVSTAKESQATSNFHLWSPCGLGNTFPVNLMGAKYTAMCTNIFSNSFRRVSLNNNRVCLTIKKKLQYVSMKVWQGCCQVCYQHQSTQITFFRWGPCLAFLKEMQLLIMFIFRTPQHIHERPKIH